MDTETLEQYRERLRTMQQQLTERVFRLETELYNMEAGRDIEHMDHAQEEAVNDEMIALDERSRQQVQEIQAALERIDDGTYGDCARCGEPIHPKRLETLPTTRYCPGIDAAEPAARDVIRAVHALSLAWHCAG
jgi:RNA polymerase-binding protein DksA